MKEEFEGFMRKVLRVIWKEIDILYGGNNLFKKTPERIG